MSQQQPPPPRAEILVVDDVRANLAVLSGVLLQHEYKVYPALSGRLALNALETLRPDLILLDIKMPEMDGFAVARAIKADPTHRDIPIIFISALDAPQDKVEAFNAGGVDYINKPFAEEEVLARVRTHVELYRTKRALACSHDRLEQEVVARTAALQNSERRLRQAQQMARLGNWELDRASHEFTWSEEIFRMFGLDPQGPALSYEQLLAQVHPDDRQRVDRVYTSIPDQLLPYDMVHRIVRPGDGEIRFVNLHTDQPAPPDNPPTTAFGTLQDVTELVQAQQDALLYHQKFHDSLAQTIEAVSATLEKRDPYTAGHQRRVALLATAIATEMGLDSNTVEGVRLGANIHDIGKIHIPAEILNRPGRLPDLEFDIVKTHSSHGYEILKNVAFPWPVAEMIHQHHERLNGEGYPNGLQGDQIIIEARIIAVADVVEAMASDRPYRPAMGIARALQTVTDGSGSEFDADAVTACLRLFNEQGYDLEHGQ